MALTNVAVKGAKPRAKEYKLADERGLYLLVTPAGGKHWRLKFRFAGKEKKLALGPYPEIGLKEARERRDDARRAIAAGIDPCVQKREAKAGLGAAKNTFVTIAEEYISKMEREERAKTTIKKARWFLSLLTAGKPGQAGWALANRPMDEITPPMLLASIRVTEAKGNLETASKLRSFAGSVFKYAVATGRAERDIAVDLRGALIRPKVTHRAAVLEPEKIQKLLVAIDAYQGHPSTRFALQILPHVFVRPGELRLAEWQEFDLEDTIWIVPAARTKMRKEHRVPLSRQVLALLGELQEITGSGGLAFPGIGARRSAISENTLNKALRTIGFGSSEMTAHGFRAMASTRLNESGLWNPDAIERALAHGDKNAIRAAYHRGTYWDERVKMMQWWSDYLYRLRDGADVVPIDAVKRG